MGLGQSFAFSERLVGLPRAGGGLPCLGGWFSSLHLPFCPMKGFVIWPGVEVVPVFPLAFPTVPQLKKLSSGGTKLPHPPPPPALYNLFVPTSLFCNQGGKREEKSLFSFLPISRDQQKTRCLVETVVNNHAEPPGADGAWLCQPRAHRGEVGSSLQTHPHKRHLLSDGPPPSSTSGPSRGSGLQEGEEGCSHSGCCEGVEELSRGLHFPAEIPWL